MNVMVTVLRHKCAGCPYCEEAAPEVFKVDDVAYVRAPWSRDGVRGVVAGSLAEKVFKAYQRCPRGGIALRPLMPYELV